jgi:flagellin
VAFTTTSTASGTLLGIASSTISVGSFSLYTLDGRAIQVDTASGVEGQNAIAASGLRVGTFSSDQATVISRLRAEGASATAPSTTTTGLLDSSTMIINGVSISQALNTDDTASDTTASSSTRAASAIAIAAAINRQANQTGVKAVAQANVLRGTGFTATTASASTLFVNNTSISVNTTTRNGVIDSINAYSSQTGVVASSFGEGVQLTAADGRNISLATKSAGANTGFGLTGITVAAAADAATTGVSATTYYSQVTLVSDNKFTVQAGKTGTANLELLGFRQGTFGGSDNGLKINQVDISTQAGASQALAAIDVALETVAKSQSKAGAVMNRLDTVINNLTESSQNIQASRSRIMDTDYATETTNLAKQQIISQAATAMLAQANQQGQAVLSLLK